MGNKSRKPKGAGKWKQRRDVPASHIKHPGAWAGMRPPGLGFVQRSRHSTGRGASPATVALERDKPKLAIGVVWDSSTKGPARRRAK